MSHDAIICSSKCHKMSQDVTRYRHMSQDVIRCHKMSQDVTRCCKMSQDVTRCHKMSQDVTRCHKMSQDVTRCRHMSQDERILHKIRRFLSLLEVLKVTRYHKKSWMTLQYVTWCHNASLEMWQDSKCDKMSQDLTRRRHRTIEMSQETTHM
jgi:hypothetical protein